jgi:hypothetical protein
MQAFAARHSARDFNLRKVGLSFSLASRVASISRDIFYSLPRAKLQHKLKRLSSSRFSSWEKAIQRLENLK